MLGILLLSVILISCEPPGVKADTAPLSFFGGTSWPSARTLQCCNWKSGGQQLGIQHDFLEANEA